MTENKRNIWRRKVEETKNATDMWNMVRNIQNNPLASSKGKALLHNGSLCKTVREKANAFASYYKSVSTLKLRKEDRWPKRETNDFLKTNAADEESFKIEEMEAALSQLKTNKAAGPDHIHPKMIMQLRPLAKTTLLFLFNTVWNQSIVPQKWRTSDVRPIPKKNKNLENIESYRPINLTWVIGKVLERMICKRMKHHLETNNRLC